MRSMVRSWMRISCTMVLSLGCGGGGGGPTGGGGGQTVTLTARHGHAMVYDEARHQLLLFGGTGIEGTSPSEVRNSNCRWDGLTWTRIATVGPSPRNHAVLAYDAT